MATAMASWSFASALASSQSGSLHGREQQQQMPDGVRGRNRGERTAILTNGAACRTGRAFASFRACKFEHRARLNASCSGGGADFIRVSSSQSKVRRVGATCRLDDEVREWAEIDGDHTGEMSSLESENSGKEVQIDLQLPRRRLLVEFTCNVCQTRTQRLVNPEAYKRGTVYVQCGGCETYHQLVDNLGLVVEYDFRNEIDSTSS